MSFLDSTGVATLTSDIKTITDATYPANAAIASDYDSTSAYAVGDCCIHGGLLYTCNTAIASGGETWTAAHWTQVNVESLISEIIGLPSVTSSDNGKVAKVVDGDWSVALDGNFIAEYGKTTYAVVLQHYQANKIMYCRASSNSNPATGNQLRLAFLAYVNNQAAPTEFEFQYYRSVATHTDATQGDQVYVYKLNSAGTWSVTIRNAYTKIVAGTGLKSTYSNGVLTISLDS